MGWQRDPEKFQRHLAEAKNFWAMANGNEHASVEDLLGRPFLPPKGPPERYPTDAYTRTSPGDDRDDILYRLQQLAQLYESGVLTQQEFTAAKERILQGM